MPHARSRLLLALHAAALAAPLAAQGIDFRVGSDGSVSLGTLGPAQGTFTGLCIDANGKLGTCSIAAVTSIATGAGLTGGPITSSGTISIANGGVGTTQLADGAVTTVKLANSAVTPEKILAVCAPGLFLKSTGVGWVCSADLNSGGTVTGVTASAPLASSGGAAPNISLTGGALGEVLAGTGTGSAWTGSPTLSGNLILAATSTSTTGSIRKGVERFIHNTGTDNTFVGLQAGNFSTTGTGQNTGVGYRALIQNTEGTQNTATGALALSLNATGSGNTANGASVLTDNTTGNENTGSGYSALLRNSSGSFNTAIGSFALVSNRTGSNNTALGANAMSNSSPGDGNVALGAKAGIQITGSNNVAIGTDAGFALTSGNNNIAIGNLGVAAESATIRIGSVSQTRAFIAGIRGRTTGTADGIAVLIDSNGQLGTVSSSRTVKQDVADMGTASSALMSLRPVTFRYRQHGPDSPLHYGLIAEEVANTHPGLVAHSADGRIETVMYHHLTPMLLNEYQKQQRTIERQAARIDSLEEQVQELASLRAETARLAAILETLGAGALKTAAR